MTSCNLAGVIVNDLPLLSLPVLSWDLERRLAHLGPANGRHTTGAGARRRRSYEHQLDDHEALLDALRGQGRSVTMDRSGRQRKATPARRAARPSTAILHAQTFEPWDLLYAPVTGHAPGLHALRARALGRLAVLREHQPSKLGWAMSQSRARADRKEPATRWLLPRASWAYFFGWRRVVRELVALLLLLRDWWETLIPARRFSATTALPEEPRSNRKSDSEAGTRYRDQRTNGGGPLPVAELLRFAM